MKEKRLKKNQKVQRVECEHYLELNGVGKRYTTGAISVEALKDVSFSLNEDEFAVVRGSSGAGKTTLLNLLGGMDTASSGSIILDGKDVTKLNRYGLTEYRRNDVGFVFQFYNLMPNLTALENVEIAVEICKDALSPKEILEEVGLGERLSFPAASSSACRSPEPWRKIRNCCYATNLLARWITTRVKRYSNFCTMLRSFGKSPL